MELLDLIIQPHEMCLMPRERSLSIDYLDFLREVEILADLGFLFSGISKLILSGQVIELQDKFEDLVVKLKHLKEIFIYSCWPRIDESLFRKMLTIWTKLDALFIENPSEQIGQYLLDQMPGYWPNLSSLVLDQKPEELRFVTQFKNLRELCFKFNLPREETMFLMQACTYLYCLFFYNEPNKNQIFLINEERRKSKESLKNSQKFELRTHHDSEDQSDSTRSFCLFDSLEQMIDHYYDNDMFNASFKKIDLSLYLE